MTKNTLRELIQKHDSEIDVQFFQTMSMMAQHLLDAGQQDAIQAIILIQKFLSPKNSTYGKKLIEQQAQQEQIVEEVTIAIQKLGNNASREDVLGLAIAYADKK